MEKTITETYEQRRAREIEQEAVNLKRLKNIALILGYTPDQDNEYKTASIHIRNGNKCLWLRAGGWKNDNRLEVCGTYPRDCKGSQSIRSYDNPPKSITISLTKDDEQIAKEILKRVMPDYLIMLEKALKRVEEIAQAEQDRNHVIKQLGGILGIKPTLEAVKDGHNTNDKASIHHWRGNDTDMIKSLDISTDYHAKEVKFELCVNNDLAVSIAELLKFYVKKGA